LVILPPPFLKYVLNYYIYGDMSITFWNIQSVRHFPDSSGEIMALELSNTTSVGETALPCLVGSRLPSELRFHPRFGRSHPPAGMLCPSVLEVPRPGICIKVDSGLGFAR